MKLNVQLEEELNKLDQSDLINFVSRDETAVEIVTDSFSHLFDNLVEKTDIVFAPQFSPVASPDSLGDDTEKKSRSKSEELLELIALATKDYEGNERPIFTNLESDVLEKKLKEFSKHEDLYISFFSLIYQDISEKAVSLAPLVFYKVKVVKGTDKKYHLSLVENIPYFNELLIYQIKEKNEIDLSHTVDDFSLLDYYSRIYTLVKKHFWAVEQTVFLNVLPVEQSNLSLETYLSINRFPSSTPLVSLETKAEGTYQLEELPYLTFPLLTETATLLSKNGAIQVKESSTALRNKLIENLVYNSLLTKQSLAIVNPKYQVSGNLHEAKLFLSGKDIKKKNDLYSFLKSFETVSIEVAQENLDFIATYQEKTKKYFEVNSVYTWRSSSGESIKDIIVKYNYYRSLADATCLVDLSAYDKKTLLLDLSIAKKLEGLELLSLMSIKNSPMHGIKNEVTLEQLQQAIVRIQNVVKEYLLFCQNIDSINFPKLANVGEIEVFANILNIGKDYEGNDLSYIKDKDIDEKVIIFTELVKKYEELESLKEQISLFANEKIYSFNWKEIFADVSDNEKHLARKVKTNKKEIKECLNSARQLDEVLTLLQRMINVEERIKLLVLKGEGIPSANVEEAKTSLQDLQYDSRLLSVIQSEEIIETPFLNKYFSDEKFASLINTNYLQQYVILQKELSEAVASLRPLYTFSRNFESVNIVRLVNNLQLLLFHPVYYSSYMKFLHIYENELSSTFKHYLDILVLEGKKIDNIYNNFIFSYYCSLIKEFEDNTESKQLSAARDEEIELKNNYPSYEQIIKDNIIVSYNAERKEFTETLTFKNFFNLVRESFRDHPNERNKKIFNEHFEVFSQIVPLYSFTPRDLELITKANFDLVIIEDSQEMTNIELLKALSAGKSVVVINKTPDERINNYGRSDLSYEALFKPRSFNRLEIEFIKELFKKSYLVNNYDHDGEIITNCVTYGGGKEPAFSFSFDSQIDDLDVWKMALLIPSLLDQYRIPFFIVKEYECYKDTSAGVKKLINLFRNELFTPLDERHVSIKLAITSTSEEKIAREVDLQRKYYYLRHSFSRFPELKELKELRFDNDRKLLMLLPASNETIEKYGLASTARKQQKNEIIRMENGFYFSDEVTFRTSSKGQRTSGEICYEEIFVFVKQFINIFKNMTYSMIQNELLLSLDFDTRNGEIAAHLDKAIDILSDNKYIEYDGVLIRKIFG